MLNGTLFKINNVSYPAPSYNDFSYETQRLVNNMRNNLGEDISQPVGVELEKFNLTWPILSASEWESILQLKQQHRVKITYYSPVRRGVVSRTFYWGNSKQEVLKWQETTDGLLRPLEYKNCNLNLIDSGWLEEQ